MSSVVGETIEEIRPMTDEELQELRWDSHRGMTPPVVILSNGVELYPSRDPEGNAPGALFGEDSEGLFMIAAGAEE